MTALAFFPIVFSLLLLGAHFFRVGAVPAVAAVVVLMVLLVIRKPWAARLVQAGLVFGLVEWLRTLIILTIERIHAGLPYQRMLIILGAVALTALISALLFQTRSLRRIYGLRVDKDTGKDTPGDDGRDTASLENEAS